VAVHRASVLRSQLDTGMHMINIILENTDQGDLFVSVTDLNVAGVPTILTDQRINESESFPLGVQEDGNDNGSITWRARRCDDDAKTAQRTVSVSTGDTVEVTTQFG
jgi:hypothetical protein